jgi:putative ABC transport system ATP-binding protein
MIHYDRISVSHGGTHVLKDFDLEVKRGEKVLIYGRSGTGKSTLLRLLLGFMRPDEGRIYFDGHELNRKSVWDVRRQVSYVSQDLDISEGRVSDFIEEAFAFKANHACGRKEEDLDKAMQWLELDRKLLEKQMTDISGGERQRVALAVALLLGRKVFLLDEVTSAVDPEMKERVAGYFASLEGATVLAASHDVTWLHGGGMRVVRLGG